SILDAIAYRRLPGGTAGLSTKGLVLSVACGVFMGVFYRFVAAAMYADPAHAVAGKMGSYAAVILMARGILLSSGVWSVVAMRKPVVGLPVSFRDYFAASLPTHMTGVLGGLIWGAGT